MGASREKLVDKAATAVSKGKYAKALDAYQQLERLEPSGGAWARRSGEMLRHLGRREDSIAAFARSVEGYARAGFLVKAMAVCKLILRIDPNHKAANEKLQELTEKRFAKPSRREFSQVGQLPSSVPNAAAPPVPKRQASPPPIPAAATPSPSSEAAQAPASPPPIPPAAKKKRTVPPGGAIHQVLLRDAVIGAAASPVDERITLIPIDDSDFDSAFGNAFGSIEDSMTEALRATPLFEELVQANLQILLDDLILRDVAEGEVVFRQGDVGNELYVVNEGEVRVVAEAPGKDPLEVGRLGEGEFFGEVALIADTPRNATVIATQASELLILGRETIARLVEVQPTVLTLLLRFLRARLFDRLTKTHQLLSSFSNREKHALAERFQFLEVESGVVLIPEGDVSPGLFVLLAGQITVHRASVGGEPIAVLGPGDVTGEMSLLTREPAIATVTTSTKAFVLKLPGADFRKLIMTHPQVLAYVGELADTRRGLVESLEAGSKAGSAPQTHQSMNLV